MKRIFFMFSMIALIAALGCQQESKPSNTDKSDGMALFKSLSPKMKAVIQTDMITGWFDDLTKEQIGHLTSINLKYANVTDSIINSNKMGIGKLMSFREMGQSKDAEMKTVLDENQFKTYEQNMKAYRQEIMKRIRNQ